MLAHALLAVLAAGEHAAGPPVAGLTRLRPLRCGINDAVSPREVT